MVEMIFRTSSFSTTACVEVAFAADGSARVRDSEDPDGPVLHFGDNDWAAFIAGVKAGEFDPPRS